MGKVEKFVVLSVLFLIALILVVSLTTDNPIDKSSATVLGEKPGATPSATPTLAQNPAPANSSTLLSSNVQAANAQGAATPTPAPTQPVVAPVAAAPAETLTIPTGSLIKTSDGLTRSFDDKRFFYTWQAGDTYVALASRLYGEPTKFTLIKNANEGREDVQPGEKILVPIYDVETVTSDMLAQPGDSKKAATAVNKKGDKTPAKTEKAAASGAKIHVVKKGESLWKIAKVELGNGDRWKEIFELNKDQMKSPEALRDGMKLKLP